MGFLFKRKPAHGLGTTEHGTGTPSDSHTALPLAARSTSFAINPSITIGNNVTAIPNSAISISTARSPSIVIGSVTRTPSPAVSTSVAINPVINGAAINPTNGQYIMGTNGAIPYYFDYAAKWTSDSNWRTNAISTSLPTYSNPALAGGRGGNNKLDAAPYLHGDGRYPDLVARVTSPDASFGPQFNEVCFEFTLPGINNAASTPTAELAGVTPDGTDYYNAIIMRRRAYCSTPEFTAIGDATSGTGISFNAGQSSAYKNGPYVTYYSGRGGLQAGNGQIIGGHPSASYDLVHNPNGGGSYGLQDISIGVNYGPEMYDGNLYIDAVHIEQWNRASDNTDWLAATYYIRLDTTSTWTQVSPRIVGTGVTPILRIFEYNLTHLNYNESRSTPLKMWITHLAAFIQDQGGLSVDPAGFLAQFAATTPQDPSAIVINSSSSSTINMTVTRGRYTGFLRVKIDGSFLVGQDYTVLREEGEYQVVGGGTTTTGKSTFSVTGLGLSAGSHTVQVFAVNKNGTVVSASGPSTTVNV